jgi:hypothetical protein
MLLVDDHESGGIERMQAMKFQYFQKQGKRIVIAAFPLLLAGCGSMITDTSTSLLYPPGVIIHNNTTSNYSCADATLSFVAAFFNAREFIDEFGEQRKETTFDLQVVISGRPETHKSYIAYVGLNIYYYSYHLYIHRIGTDLQSDFTEVGVDCGKT